MFSKKQLEVLEEWKVIPGYEGMYEASSKGNIRSLDREIKDKNGHIRHQKGKVIRTYYDKRGYKRCYLCKDGDNKELLVHQLVAKAFIPNPNNYKMINHKDETHDNNCVENLEWCDAKYNNNYGTLKQRLSELKKKKIICITDGNKFNSVNEAAEFYGIDRRLISGVLSKAKKTTYGKVFIYDEEGIKNVQ